jgi:hypothetical protein
LTLCVNHHALIICGLINPHLETITRCGMSCFINNLDRIHACA